MSEATGTASGLVSLATFALNSSLALYETVVRFQSLPKNVRDLLQELEILIAVLDVLDKLVQTTAQEDLTLLDLPLKQCGSACQDFEQEITKLFSKYGKNQISFHDWANLRYMGNNIDGFRHCLAVYKQTINIALSHTSFRKASITAETLGAYKELVRFAESDLKEYVISIDDRLEHISEQKVSKSDLKNTELYTIKEERLSAERCLKIHANLSDDIAQIELNRQSSSSSFSHTDLHAISEMHTKEGLQSCRKGFTITTARLEKYKQNVIDRLIALLRTGLRSKEELADSIRLRDEWETVQHCIDICSKADSLLKDDFITVENYGTGDVLQFMVASNDRMVHGKNRGSGWKTRQVGGYLSNISLQKLSRDMTIINIRKPANEELSSQHSLAATAKAEIGHDIPMEELSSVLRRLQLLYHKPGHKFLGADVCFFTDLHNFCTQNDQSIQSILTITGSEESAFADTAGRYVNWRWGTRGVALFTWLSKSLLPAQTLELNTSVQPLHIFGKSVEIILKCVQHECKIGSSLPSSQCNVTIQVFWVEGKMNEYCELVADVGSQLAWTVATFKEPIAEFLSFTRAVINHIRPGDFAPTNEDDRICLRIMHQDIPDQSLKKGGTCWHPLFQGLNVANSFPIPPRPRNMCGIELPIGLMSTFAGATYPVAYRGGFVLKGRINALFPISIHTNSETSDEASAVQWHLYESQLSRLYMTEVKRNQPDLLPIGTTQSPDEFYEEIKQHQRHFLGMYEDAKISTAATRFASRTVSTTSIWSEIKERKERWPIEWNRTITISLSGGGLGLSGGSSTGIRILPKKERQMHLLYDRSLEKHLDDTRSKCVLLYDVRNKIAWMLPQICVVIYLLQAWAKAKYPKVPLIYPAFDNMSLQDVKQTFEKFKNQEAASEFDIDLEGVFMQFSNLLDQLQDNELLKPAKGKHSKRIPLSGVDFARLAHQPRIYSILTSHIELKSSGDWPKMLKSNWKDWSTGPQPNRVVTLFCDGLRPQPILPRTQVCGTWFPPPVGQNYLVTTIFCLKGLADRYGRDPVRLSRIHFWERGKYLPYDPCEGRSCDRLQKVVEKSKDRSTAAILSSAYDHAAVIFGGFFIMDTQLECRSRSLESATTDTMPARQNDGRNI